MHVPVRKTTRRAGTPLLQPGDRLVAGVYGFENRHCGRPFALLRTVCERDEANGQISAVAAGVLQQVTLRDFTGGDGVINGASVGGSKLDAGGPQLSGHHQCSGLAR